MRSSRQKFIVAIIISSIVSEGLFGYGVLKNHNLDFDFLSINLLLAWLPLVFAIRLTKILRAKRWSSWEGMLFSFLWLVFLPNSFYMISDFIHLQTVPAANALYDTLVLTSFVYTGVIIGFSSMVLLHMHLQRRFKGSTASFFVGLTLFICSVAIYFGRDLRWNSWDVLTNPGGLLVDISDRIQHLTAYPEMMVSIAAFFVLLCSIYYLIWRGIHLTSLLGNSHGQQQNN